MPIAGWGSHGAESDREYEFSFYTKDRDLFFRLMTEVEQMEKKQLKWLKKDDNALKDDGKNWGANPSETPRDFDASDAPARPEGRTKGDAVIASEDAHHAIANAIDDDRTLSLFGYARAAHALAVVMPDGRTIGQWLDALAALEASTFLQNLSIC